MPLHPLARASVIAAATAAALSMAQALAAQPYTQKETGALSEPPAYPADGALRASKMLMGIRVAQENWSAARLLVRSDVNWANWVQGKKTAVDNWFAKPRDRADLVAGYPNDLVNSSSGAAVQWTQDMPEPQTGNTPAAISFKNAWSAITRMNNITFTTDAARLYQLTGETRYAKLAAEQLDFYANNYMAWPLRTAIGHARMMGQSLDEATSVLELLEAAHALRGYANTTQRARWRDSLFFPIAANLQTYSYGSLNNINLWCAVATVAIGLEFDEKSWIELGGQGPKGISAVMAQGVTADGIWFEGTFAYNNYVLLALARLFDLAAASGRPEYVERYGADVQRMLITPVLYRFDDGTLPSPGDTRMPVAPIDVPIHFALYRHVPTSYGVQMATWMRTWDTLRDRPVTSSREPTLPPAQTLFSPDIRMASLRADGWQAFVHFGQKTINHAQEEALTYELAHGKTSITRDPGAATSYSSAQQNDYFAKGLGNNVPLIDGQGQERWAPGVVKAFDPVAGTLEVLHAEYRTGVSASRSFRVNSTGFSETTRLTLTTPGAAPRRLGVIFNTRCGVQITDPRAGIASSTAAPVGAPGFKYWSGVQKQQAGARWTARLACTGGKNYELSITGSSPQTVYRATAPDTPLPATRNALYVEILGTDASFTTSIQVLP